MRKTLLAGALVRRALVFLLSAFAIATAACGRRLAPPTRLFPTATAWTAALEDFIEGPLATDGRRIFVGTRDGALRALDASTGDVEWRVEGRAGFLASSEDLLVTRQDDGSVWGLDPTTGTTLWTAQSAVPGRLPPIIDRDRVLVAGLGFAALDAATGRTLWSVEAPAATAPPVGRGNRVFVGESDGTLRCRDRETGASLWTHKTGSALLAPPVVGDDGRLFLGTTDRRVLAIGVEKGRRGWRWKVGADVQAAPVLLDGMVLVATHEDILYALKRAGGEMLWRAPLPSRPFSAPLAVGTSVLVACYEADIVGFDGRNGKKLGAIKTPAEIRTPPLILGDRLYVGLRAPKSVVAYQLGVPEQSPSPGASPTPTPAAEPPIPSPTPTPATPPSPPPSSLTLHPFAPGSTSARVAYHALEG